jgi:hypothetical protein
MVAFSFRSSALLLPWLCAGLVVAGLVDGAYASGPQQKQLRAGNNRYLQEVVLTSDRPSLVPSKSPNDAPSFVPSASPSGPPSDSPSNFPSLSPSSTPSDLPSDSPSNFPSLSPSSIPSDSPSDVPSSAPSASPSDVPSTYPSYLPSAFPSITPSTTPSNVPSDLPSDLPSTFPSATPTAIPSDVPSFTPTDIPSTVPSPTPSTVPSDGPSYVPSDMPSAAPSRVPSSAPSGLPSDVPSQVPSVVPSVVPSAAPSVFPSGVPSDFPSGVPSDIPSGTPSDVPSLIPSLVPSNSPTLKESAYPSLSPSARPSGTPSRVPSGMPSDIPSTAPSYATEYVAVDALNLLVSADSIMDTATITIFEEKCAAFLPIFLPAIYQAEFQFVECELLSQSMVTDVPAGRRRLQQGGQDSRFLAVLVRVSARANLPASIRFNDLVGQVFGTFGSTLQLNLNSASPYFGTASTLVPGGLEGGPTNTDNTGSDAKAVDFPIIIVAAAAVVGAVLAIGMAAFMLSVKRSRGVDTLPRHSTADSVGSFIIDDDVGDDDQKTGTQLSESTYGPFLPPTPIGVGSVPGEIDSESFVEPEGGLSPDSASSAPRNASREVQYLRQGSRMATAVELERSFDSTFVDPLGLGQSASAVDRSLQAVKRKSPNEGKWDMDVMKLIGSGSANVAAGNEDEFVVNPLPRRSFFGFAMGFRNQNEAKASLPHDVVAPACSGDVSNDVVAPAFSGDVSNDPMRAAVTRVGTAKNTDSHATIEECTARSPKGNFLQKNETPSGGEFLQLNVTSAAHTGNVLDDLGKSEQEWKGQLSATMSATAETPRVGNTQSANTHRSRHKIYSEREI